MTRSSRMHSARRRSNISFPRTTTDAARTRVRILDRKYVCRHMNSSAAHHNSHRNGVTMDKKIALVTGASSGIGEATAERLAKAGFTVYGTSRRGAAGERKAYNMIALDVTNDAS